MKITSLDIKGFGKFNQLKVTPGPGFNMIFAGNEAGKSTLQAFIRAMLYGMKGGRKGRDGSLPPLKRYKPWNAEQYAGVMDYSLENGDTYRVGRNFDKGTANIYDKGANNVASRFAQGRETGPRFAEEHLGIDEATFEHSVFIQQLQSVCDDDAKKGLSEKLSNLCTTGSEELSLTKAVNILETELREKVGTERSTTKPLDKLNSKLSELEQKKKTLLELNERTMETAVSLREKRNLLKELSMCLEQKKQQKKTKRIARFQALKPELEALSKETDHVEKGLSDCRKIVKAYEKYEDVTEETVSKTLMLQDSIENARESIETESMRLSDLESKRKALIESLEPEEVFEDKIETVEFALEDYQLSKESAAKKNRAYIGRQANTVKFSWLRTLAFLMVFAAFIFMGYYIINTKPLLLGGGIVVIAAVGVVWSIINMRKTHLVSKKHTDADYFMRALHNAGFNDMTDYIRYREDQLRSRGLLESTTKEIAETLAEINSIKEKYAAHAEELNRILSDFTDPPLQFEAKSAAESLKHGFEELAKAKEQERNLLAGQIIIKDKNKILLREASAIIGKSLGTYGEFKETLADLVGTDEPISSDDYTEPQLENEIEEIQQRINQVKLEAAALETRLENVPSEDELVKVTEEAAFLREQKEKVELAGLGLIMAKQILNESALKLQWDYIPALNEEMSKMMSLLSSGRYENIRTDDRLQVNLEVPETDELISVSRLSGGTVDQVYFCMRLATVLLLERDREILPIFLDEPFSQYDENRVIEAFKLLKHLSIKHQIFFFTCRASELRLAEDVFGDDMNKINL